MKIVAWLLFACCAINIANVEAGEINKYVMRKIVIKVNS